MQFAYVFDRIKTNVPDESKYSEVQIVQAGCDVMLSGSEDIESECSCFIHNVQ